MHKVNQVEEKESRGFYEQQLLNLKPCSTYRCLSCSSESNLVLVQGGRSWLNLWVWASQLGRWTDLQERMTGNSKWTILRSSRGADNMATQSNTLPHGTHQGGGGVRPLDNCSALHWRLQDHTLSPPSGGEDRDHFYIFLWRNQRKTVGSETSVVQVWRTKTTSSSRFNSPASMTSTSTLTTARFSEKVLKILPKQLKIMNWQ